MFTSNTFRYSEPIFRRSISESSNQSPPSSAESEEALPHANDNSVDRVMGHPVSRPGASMRLPPLPPTPPARLDR